MEDNNKVLDSNNDKVTNNTDNTNNTKNDKNKSVIKIVIIICILIMAICFAGFYFYNSSVKKESKNDNKHNYTKVDNGKDISSLTTDNQDGNKEESSVSNNTYVNELCYSKDLQVSQDTGSSINNKLMRFVKAGSYRVITSDTVSSYENFINGTKSISKEIKLKMAYNAIKIFKYYEPDRAFSEDDLNGVNTHMSDIPIGEPVMRVKISDFNNIYYEFFHETPVYELEDLKYLGCPAPWAINSRLGYIYLFHRCGGAGGPDYKNTITSYDSDNDYYYVHQDLYEYYCNSSDVKISKLVWKFDKNLNFISTTVE